MDFRVSGLHAASIQILLLITAVQALNLLVFAWFNRTAGLRILVLRQRLAAYKRRSKKPLLKKQGSAVLILAVKDLEGQESGLILVIMELASRKVIHVHVAGHPTLERTKRQIRNACFEVQPMFLLHDNDGKFGQLLRPLRVECAGKEPPAGHRASFRRRRDISDCQLQERAFLESEISR